MGIDIIEYPTLLFILLSNKYCLILINIDFYILFIKYKYAIIKLK